MCDVVILQSDGNHAYFKSLGRNVNGQMHFKVQNPITTDDGKVVNPNIGRISHIISLYNFTVDPLGKRGYLPMKLGFRASGAHILRADFDGDGHPDVMNVDTYGEDTYLMLARTHVAAGPGKMVNGRQKTRGNSQMDFRDFSVVPNYVTRSGLSTAICGNLKLINNPASRSATDTLPTQPVANLAILKVGDAVRVDAELHTIGSTDGAQYTANFATDMAKYKGKVGRISSVSHAGDGTADWNHAQLSQKVTVTFADSSTYTCSVGEVQYKGDVGGFQGFKLATRSRSEKVAEAHTTTPTVQSSSEGKGLQDELAATIACGPGCSHVLHGDFNGDGRADVLTLQSDGAHALFLSLGTRQGILQFQKHHPIPSLLSMTFTPDSPRGSSQAVVGDFNSDGYSDVLIIDADGSHSLATSNGDGSFKEYPPVCAATRDEETFVADVFRTPCKYPEFHGVPGFGIYLPSPLTTIHDGDFTGLPGSAGAAAAAAFSTAHIAEQTPHGVATRSAVSAGKQAALTAGAAAALAVRSAGGTASAMGLAAAAAAQATGGTETEIVQAYEAATGSPLGVKKDYDHATRRQVVEMQGASKAQSYTQEGGSWLMGREGEGEEGQQFWLEQGDWNGDGMLDFIILQRDGNHAVGMNRGVPVLVPPSISYHKYSRSGRYHKYSRSSRGSKQEFDAMGNQVRL